MAINCEWITSRRKPWGSYVEDSCRMCRECHLFP